MILVQKIKPSKISISKRQILPRRSILVEDMEENAECARQDIMKEN